ncbi:hypothetical protein ACSBR2_028637 [Camellia fascicularis]
MTMILVTSHLSQSTSSHKHLWSNKHSQGCSLTIRHISSLSHNHHSQGCICINSQGCSHSISSAKQLKVVPNQARVRGLKSTCVC